MPNTPRPNSPEPNQPPRRKKVIFLPNGDTDTPLKGVNKGVNKAAAPKEDLSEKPGEFPPRPPQKIVDENDELGRLLSRNGILASGLNEGGRTYEERPEQLEMARAVQRAIDERAHLLVEAGTGVGKSYAYLLPFILWAVRERKKVLIATHTKALQQQLVERDLPFLHQLLQDELNLDFKYALCLGTSNYLCPRRLGKAQQVGLFATKNDIAELQELHHWAMHTPSGRNIDLPFEPSRGLWSQVNRESDLCLGRACPLYEKSFYYIARREQEKAHILIANHHLLFAHLSKGGNVAGAVLPPFDALVLDEAHTAEDVASAYLGLEVTNLGMARLLETLHHRRSGKTPLAEANFNLRDTREKALVEAVEEARVATSQFFGNLQVELNLDARRTQTLRLREPLKMENALDEPLARVQKALGDARREAENAGEDGLVRELDGFAARCDQTRVALSEILQQMRPEHVYWVAMQPRQNSGEQNRVPRLSLHAAPIEIAQALRKTVFDAIRPVVLTSATLTTGQDFSFLRSRLGLDDEAIQAARQAAINPEIDENDKSEAATIERIVRRETKKEEPADVQTLSLGSPFDYATNALLYVGRDLPDPTHGQYFENAAIERAVDVVERTRGRAFVLCTSFRMVDATARRLRDTLPTAIHVFAQGEGGRGALLESFRRDTSSVLVGTTSFWQGVDVPGESLSCVVLMKLPFAVPDDPMVQARVESLRERGGNPFTQYQVPQAVMMFRQGFGRLIRTHQDRGIVAILDPRVSTKSYGRTFLDSLPPCPVTFELDDIEEFCAQ